MRGNAQEEALVLQAFRWPSDSKKTNSGHAHSVVLSAKVSRM